VIPGAFRAWRPEHLPCSVALEEGATHMKDIFAVSSPYLPESARLVGFRGTEQLCRPYELELYFTVADQPDFDLADGIGGRASLVGEREEDRGQFVIHGILSSIKLLHEVHDRALYRAVLVPRLWRLGRTRHSRIFTKQTIPDIIKDVLVAAGLPETEFELRLDHTYDVEEHVCQYAESDLDFIHRWLEREGMYYFFEHGEREEKLIITDMRSFHVALEDRAVRYHPLAGDDASAGECFDAITCEHVDLPERVRLADYDYAKPKLEVVGTAQVAQGGEGEVSIHGARFFTPDRGKRLAEVRSEELRTGQTVFHAEGTALFVRAGYTFKIEEHPRNAFNREYLATTVRHFGNQAVGSPELKRHVRLPYEDVYRVEVGAIASDVQFRPRQDTPWPRIHGSESGVVDGEGDSEYAQIDEDGRYRVRFRFDESDLKPGKASTYVRMMQPHGGGIEGWHFPLRKGTEVVFTFLGGDPDRPVIAGVVPNALTPSPVTSANHTKNVIQTGGRNRLELEDKAGFERVTLSTPHSDTYIRMGAPNPDYHMILNTDGTVLLHSGGDWQVDVDMDVRETVKGNIDEKYLTNKTELVGGSTTETYTGDQDTTVHAIRKETYAQQRTHVKGGRTDVIYGGLTQLVDGGVDLTADRWKQIVKGPMDVTAPKVKWTTMGPWDGLTYGATSNTFIGIRNANFIGGQISTNLAMSATMTLGATADLFIGAKLAIANALSLTVTGGAALTIDAALKLTVSSIAIDKMNLKIKASAATELAQAGIQLYKAGLHVVQ
jgi:type VI secretion system secreted protein VgrG